MRLTQDRDHPWLGTHTRNPVGYVPVFLELFKRCLDKQHEGRRRRGQQRTGWLEGIIDSMDINSSKLRETVEDRGAWCAVVHVVTESDMT